MASDAAVRNAHPEATVPTTASPCVCRAHRACLIATLANPRAPLAGEGSLRAGLADLLVSRALSVYDAPGGKCLCAPGAEPVSGTVTLFNQPRPTESLFQCTVCKGSFYKPIAGDVPCIVCPNNAKS